VRYYFFCTFQCAMKRESDSTENPKAPQAVKSGRGQFFTERTAEDFVSVAEVVGKGVAVFAKSKSSQGDVIFRDVAAGVVQKGQYPRACAECLRLTGTLDEVWHALPGGGAGDLPGLTAEDRQLAPPIAWAGAWEPDGVFCCQECLDQHRSALKALDGKAAQVAEFRKHSRDVDTVFFDLALLVVARNSDVLGHLCQAPYWECVDRPDTGVDEFIAGLQAENERSFELLQKLQLPGAPSTAHEWSCVVGALCRNAIMVKFANPLVAYVQEVDLAGGEPQLALGKRIEQLLAASPGHGTGADDDNSDAESESSGDQADDELNFAWEVEDRVVRFSTKLFPALKGYGLYPKLAAVNHSCEPNAVGVFCGDANLLLLASRTIRKGEEICIDYIDNEEDDAETRRQALLPYGFICGCPRCPG